MREVLKKTGKRITCFVGAGALLSGGIGATLLLTASAAGATGCGTATTSSCTTAGSLDLTAGTLSLTAPGTLGWGSQISGNDLSLYDTTSGDQSYIVNDATGSGAGWNVTLAATQFTTGGGSPHTLGNSGTLSTNGSISAATDTTTPTSACYTTTTTTCTLPTLDGAKVTYPVAVTTGASVTAVEIYSDNTSHGLGEITLSNVGWWLQVPANTYAGTYTSTFTLGIVSAP